MEIPMKRAARRDSIEPLVLVALDAVEATYVQLDLTHGPDLLIGYCGETNLVELKSTLADVPTDDQEHWHKWWQGRRVGVCRSPQEVLARIGAPWTLEVREAIAKHSAREYLAVLGPKARAKLMRGQGRLTSSVKRSAP
jgi:hypothetical protein